MKITVNLMISKTQSGNFDYTVTDQQFKQLQVGAEVIVNFSNQLRTGIVMKIDDNDSGEYQLKPILMVVRDTPLNNYQQQLATSINIMSLAAPSKVYSLFNRKISKSKIDINFYDDNNQLVGSFNKSKNKQQLIDNYRGELIVTYQDNPREIQYASLNHHHEYNLTAKGQIVYDYLQENETAKITDIIAETGVSRSVITTLLKNEVISLSLKPHQFDELYQLHENRDVQLTVKQHQVITNQQSGRVNLLRGVSSSGKTEIYINLAKSVSENNQQTLVIVPSVMLAVQVVGKFQNEFKDCIIYHRDLSEDRKKSYKQQIANNQKSVVIGTVDALFLPFDNLGQIIIDECHHPSYYYERGINIDITVLVEKLAAKINVLLGSATPTISQYAKGKQGYYHLHELTERYFGNGQQKIEFVDNSLGEISRELSHLISANKTASKPTMILYNVNGYSRQLMCKRCFHIPTCPHCNMPLTYHQQKGILKCKFDGYQSNYHGVCPQCHSHEIEYMGTGIEQFSQKLAQHFPDLKIAEVTSKLPPSSLYQVMIDFSNGDIDILIGTQVIAFGIDFLNVESIYICNTDNLLMLDEFSAHEQSYNFLEQAAKRVGRFGTDFNVYIETKFPDNFVLKALVNEDFPSYYSQELTLRKLGRIAPYYKICKIMFSCVTLLKLENLVQEVITELHASDYSTTQIQVPYLEVINKKYRRYIVITYRDQNLKNKLQPLIANLNLNGIDTDVHLDCNKIGV